MVKRGAVALSGKKVSAGLQVGSYVNVSDNSGARVAMIIGVPGYRGRLRRVPQAGVGDKVIVSVKKGIPEMRKQILPAVIIRQKRPFRRSDGTWVSFEDNAVVIITPEGTLKGSEIRGPVAREAVERWPRIANMASIIL
ncbi:MAG: 50S ribosomal protein L14 [Fervidicoccaceae archaeon]|jgi:large subunit ribosomal protein L14|uniref:Large ribosomal subunit protein uL14 n=1 Tax=Fervidicoccus fontis TaxID=683846 RepID=A0A7C2Z003_9CREN|nr:MAG: 50S ribosomal protein L14 [Fervidicoccus sp.]HEU98073.1 50S ribosomal protein L14 [Fervidicoccus fontis]